MTDLDAEYEKFLDNEALEKLSRIKFSEIQEAMAHPNDDDAILVLIEASLEQAVRVGDEKNSLTIGLIIRTICYEYWRGIMANHHNFHDWEQNRTQDRQAAKEEQGNEDAST